METSSEALHWTQSVMPVQCRMLESKLAQTLLFSTMIYFVINNDFSCFRFKTS